jgi:anti-sigma factor RsiW
MKHLSSEQFSNLVLGQPDSEAARHMAGCRTCRSEIANFRQALGEFRGAVRNWSDDQAAAALEIPERTGETRSWIAAHQLALAVLLAAVCLLASVFVPWYGRRARGPANDAVLLNQVDAQVSRTAPSSLEPLMKLVVERQE